MTPRPTGSTMVLALTGLLCACADQRSAGGTTETDNMVAARDFRIDSLLQERGIPHAVAAVATIRIDSTVLDFSETSANGRDLAVEAPGHGPIPFRTVFWDKLARIGRIEARIDPTLRRTGNRIRLRWGLPDSLRSDSAMTWRGIPDSVRKAIASVLVDDFEDSNLVSGLPSKGTWTTHSGGDSAHVSAPRIAPAGASRPGRALSITYSMVAIKGYVLVTVPLTTAPRTMRSIDSIEFWARGDSTIVSVALEHKSDTTATKAWADRKLTASWQRYTVRPGDFVAPTPASGNVGWLGIRDSVTTLTLFGALGKELWIDDIRIHGVDRDDMD